MLVGPAMVQSAAFPLSILTHKDNIEGPTSPSGAGGAASSAASLGLDDVTASPAASLLASESATLGAYVTVITNTSTKFRVEVFSTCACGSAWARNSIPGGTSSCSRSPGIRA